MQDAQAAGFAVGEDLSVTDRTTGGSATQMAARQAQAQAFAAEIGGRAATLVSTDAQVGARVTAAVAGIGSKFPQTPSTNGQVQAVDNHTFKQDPSFPTDPTSYGSRGARRVGRCKCRDQGLECALWNRERR